MNAHPNHRSIQSDRRVPVLVAALSAVLAVGLTSACIKTVIENNHPDATHVVDLLAKPNGKAAEGEALAHNVLRRDPYTPPVLRALAQEADRNGRHQEAANLMTVSGGLTWRDPITDGWLAQDQLNAGDFNAGVKRLDALLRMKPELVQPLLPSLMNIIRSPEGAQAVASRLAFQPGWRGWFIENINAYAPPESVFGVLSRLQTTSSPPSLAEASGYVQKLVALKRYDEALLGAFLFLPKERLSAFNSLFNGNFDDIHGILPFDWAISNTTGSSLTMEPAALRAGRALHVFSDGSTRAVLISQYLSLPAGSYRFAADAFSEVPASGDHLRWIIRCLNSTAPALTAAPPAEATWRTYSFDFTVPAVDCPAQILQLEVSPAERRTSVEMWYDKLTIQRVAA